MKTYPFLVFIPQILELDILEQPPNCPNFKINNFCIRYIYVIMSSLKKIRSLSSNPQNGLKNTKLRKMHEIPPPPLIFQLRISQYKKRVISQYL